MSENIIYSLIVPHDIMLQCAERVRVLRIEQNMPQTELAERTGVAVGTIKRFERTGEIQFRTLLEIALVLGRLDDFADLFRKPDVPVSLYRDEPEHPRQRARKKNFF